MKKIKGSYDYILYVIGLIAISSLYVEAIFDYRSIVEQNVNISTKARGLQIVIQKLDELGGSLFVYSFLSIIVLFFLYKIFNSIRDKNE